MTKPVVPSAVAYRHMRGWQRPGMKLSGQSNLSSVGILKP